MKISVATRMSAAPTAARGPSVYAIASKGFRVREIGVFNTTSTAAAIGVAIASAAGTQGAALTEVTWDKGINNTAPSATGFNTHTADATVGSCIRQASLGATVGSGVIWTFPDEGIVIAPGTGNGIVIVCPTGTGQVCDFYIDWEE